MAIVLIAPGKNNLDYWKKALIQESEKEGIQTPVMIGPEVENPDQVKMAVVWKHAPESLHQFKNLKVVSSMGAGVDHILKDKEMPAEWQVTRIVDPELTSGMSNYLLAAVLSHHKRLWEYVEKQQKKEWAYTDEPERKLSTGILGMGELGMDIAKKLVALGFPVSGYSNNRKEVPSVKSFAGKAELPHFLNKSNLLICLLPLTEETNGFLNRDLFQQCSPGTFLINVARGEHLVEEDLLPALDNGWLSGAMLDVFQKEPLPPQHPFWKRKDVIITPHIASVTNPDAAIPQIIENYKNILAGGKLLNRIDRNKGY